MILASRKRIIPFAIFIVSGLLLVAAFILGNDFIARLPGLQSSTSPKCAGAVSWADGSNATDWWDCPEMLPEYKRVFNKSIFYIKPHKTGSESFKKILLRISDYYNLSNKMQEKETQPANKGGNRSAYDVLISHQYYQEGTSEHNIRGWENGDFEVGKNGEAPKRHLTKVVTTRNPIDRLFSHYFSQRRFGNFVPARGNVSPRKLSYQEELSDFLEWLESYPSDQQVRYLMNTPRETRSLDENTVMLQRIEKIVNFYDHVVVTEQWKQSLCLFGFTERIKPQLLKLRAYNSNKPRVRRFDVQMAITNTSTFEKVLSKVRYDFLLYQALFKKYTKKLDELSSPGMQRYCALVT